LIISVAVIPRAPVQPVIQAPAVNRSSSDVKLSFGQSAALAGVKMVTFVVTDANNKVVRKTTVKLNPEAKGAGIQIPTNLPGAKVQVFTGNECGVSPNAPDDMNIKRGKTATSVNKRGIPELRGDMILPAVDFGPSEIKLDKEDKARLREVAKEVKGRCGTLFLSGFSRFNDKDSERYLQNLANFRAEAVADYLSSIGVKMWLVYQGFIVKSNDSSGLYRRVELRWEPA
jgi:outer membrane protein OmpA-like peptidoglycan-associated protein